MNDSAAGGEMERPADGADRGKLEQIYDGAFYQRHRDDARRSAEIIVPLVMELVRPASVVDVGCGVAVWLDVFRRAGVERVLGLDGAHVNPRDLAIEPERFREVDLETAFEIPGRFDLAVNLEVAEHLTPAAGRALVGALTAAAPVVMFSAAVPWQGGDNHINEQWPSYWIAEFAKHGFRALDAIRPRILGDQRVVWWYRQNLLLFASPAAHPALAEVPPPPPEFGVEWVHVSVHSNELADYATLRRARPALKRKLARIARRVLRLHERS
jgi:hypothetical protein